MRNPYRAPEVPQPALPEPCTRVYVSNRTVWDDVADSIGREQDRRIAELMKGSDPVFGIMTESDVIGFFRNAEHTEGCRYPTHGCGCVVADNWYGWEHPLTFVKNDGPTRSWLDQYVS